MIFFLEKKKEKEKREIEMKNKKMKNMRPISSSPLKKYIYKNC
jgi:hypothetical protein